MVAKKIVSPHVTLSSGHKMPLIGMGTATYPLLPTDSKLVFIFTDAIEAGYRHFDTALIYGSEKALGLAVKNAIDKGIITSREELFITSKLWCSDAHPDLILPALNRTLQNLGMEYVDLYLIHWPVRLKQGSMGPGIPKEDILPFDLIGTWEAMENCSNLGLAKSIGVSNYGPKKLAQILQHAAIPPAINQVEMNVAWQQQSLLQFCKTNGIQVTAWSPLSGNGAPWGSLQVMDNPILKEIATKKNKSIAQIALRWLYQQGAGAVVKSFNTQRMKENLQIIDFELSEDELKTIKQIPQRRTVSGENWIHENGPYKTLNELWDE